MKLFFTRAFFFAISLNIWAFETIAEASGELIINPAITGSQEESHRGDSTSKDTVIRLNVGAGTTFGDGYYVGIKYLSSGIENTFDDSADTSKAELHSYGVSVGYYSKASFTLCLSLLINPEYTLADDDDSASLKGGTGYLLDIGWRTKINATWSVGPQLSYTSVTYKKIEVDGSTSNLEGGTWSDKQIYPYLGLWLFF